MTLLLAKEASLFVVLPRFLDGDFSFPPDNLLVRFLFLLRRGRASLVAGSGGG